MSFYPSSLLRIPHITFDPDYKVWCEGYNRPPPYLQIVLSVHPATYELFEVPMPASSDQNTLPAISTWAVADTGSNLDLISLDTLNTLRYDPTSLLGVATEAMGVVPATDLELKGGLFLNVRATDPHLLRTSQTRSLFYIAEIQNNHLSRDSMESLSIIGHRFPRLRPLRIPRNL